MTFATDIQQKPQQRHRKIGVLFFVLVLAGLGKAAAQDVLLTYAIKRNGEAIGHMKVKQVKSGSRTTYRMTSEINTRVIFRYTAKGAEEAVYDNGLLIYSSVYQNLNGKEKVNKKTALKGAAYTTSDGGTERQLPDKAITYNMVCLYNNEPQKVGRVYSDKYQRLLPIEKLGAGRYKIAFPDGNSNTYHYANGICTRVVVDHTLYSVVMELQ